MKIEIKILNKEFYATLNLPTYATAGSAGVDLITTQAHCIKPGQQVDIHTGLALWIGSDVDYFASLYSRPGTLAGLVLPRSGLGSKGLILANTIGVIDQDYQGEIIIKAWNRLPKVVKALGSEHKYQNNDITIAAGDRIAQLLFVPVVQAEWDIVDEFSNETTRGVNGFGSTGH